MAMIYRNRVEFAVGHGVSIHAETPTGVSDHAVRLSTRVIPAAEVPMITAPTSDDVPALGTVVRDMKELAQTEGPDFAAKLGPLVTAYREWMTQQTARIEIAPSGLGEYKDVAVEAMKRCQEACDRIQAGLALLGTNAQAAEAFRFLNEAMWQQRIHGTYAEKVRRGEPDSLEDLDIANNRSWFPFQLAFILLNLPALTDLHHPERIEEQQAIADLLWFPTGGGKTEAYLGLAAYAMALRRLQGAVAGRSGEHGVAVLMRYTLRLLTLQQFQRAATLLCACETIRREAVAAGDTRWGTTPFRIGLWVGQRTTPNTTEQSAEAVRQAHGHFRATVAGGFGSPAQLTNCPWCGSPIDPGKHIRVEPRTSGRGRTLTYCGDRLGHCPFSERQAPGEGLPVVVVDEEIYRLLPAMLVATVDKFAQMPWNGATQMLFGQVDALCPRHGFRSPEIEDADSHPARAPYPATKTIPAQPLRPPDLIIQDELHLISGPLGTLVGLYETAVDRLATWEVDGKLVRPKVIASTATIRRAPDQVHALFVRRVRVFPPHGLDVEGNFFSLQRPPSEEYPGRRYLGICAPGRRLKAALIRVYVAFLAAAQQLYEKYGREVDPWMTLVGYFNAMRELGGMRRLVDDDVRTRLAKADRLGLAARTILYDSVDELTSRKGGTDIPQVLDALEAPFDPALEAKRKAMIKAGQKQGLPRKPLDVLLATNMLSVGVDVRRLGLMVVAGQPKTTAEYIQATSRVGRAAPGLVCTVLNWVRPRDLSHYERFEHYHATFYKHVEALSVTPFSPRAIDRGLTALLVSCIRLMGTEFNENLKAGRIERQHPYVQTVVEHIARRAHLVGAGAAVEQLVRAELAKRIDEWLDEAQRSTGGRRLGYRASRDGLTVGLLRRPGRDRWHDFACLNSLRDVEPEVGLVLDDRGLDDEQVVVPVIPAGDDDQEAAQ
jgi:Helicase conserved C-terminal domain